MSKTKAFATQKAIIRATEDLNKINDVLTQLKEQQANTSEKNNHSDSVTLSALLQLNIEVKAFEILYHFLTSQEK